MKNVFSQRDCSPYRSNRTTCHTACRRAGVKVVSPHVLRHTFREPPGDGRRRPPDDTGTRRLGLARHGAALQPLEPASNGASRAMSGKLLKIKGAPVAQVDRAAVS